MAEERLQKHLPLLKYLAHGKAPIVKSIIKESGPEVIKVICECANNVIKENVKLPKHHLKKLRPHRRKVYKLADKKISLKNKKRILQTGGFLGTLLKAIIPAVSAIFGNLG